MAKKPNLTLEDAFNQLEQFMLVVKNYSKATGCSIEQTIPVIVVGLAGTTFPKALRMILKLTNK